MTGVIRIAVTAQDAADAATYRADLYSWLRPDSWRLLALKTVSASPYTEALSIEVDNVAMAGLWKNRPSSRTVEAEWKREKPTDGR